MLRYTTAVCIAVCLAVLLALVLELKRLQLLLEQAREELRRAHRTGEASGSGNCQTRCDRDCSRFDDCRGEAWVCINLFEMLESDSGPVLYGEHARHMQCHPPLRKATRHALRTLIRKHIASIDGGDEHRVAADAPLPLTAASASRSIAFQADAETLIQRDGFSRRRVAHDKLSKAVARQLSLDALVGEMAGGECQPTGIRLPHLARARFFNSSHWTFATGNLHQDAALFLFDLSFQQRAAFNKLTWLGVNTEQDPFDAFAIQELVVRLKPDLVSARRRSSRPSLHGRRFDPTPSHCHPHHRSAAMTDHSHHTRFPFASTIAKSKIIETGTYKGGSALFLASLLRLVHPSGRVHTSDPWGSRLATSYAAMSSAAKALWLAHVVHYPNSSLSDDVVQSVARAAEAVRVNGGVIMVLLDSNHERDFVMRELAAYSRFVTPGSYLVVQDTKMDRMMASDDGKAAHWRGPGAAVADFLADNIGRFELDRGPEALWYSQHPRGFLKRRR